jgi:hypothetical protein
MFVALPVIILQNKCHLKKMAIMAGLNLNVVDGLMAISVSILFAKLIFIVCIENISIR